MSEDEDMNEYPDFVQIGKSSPSHESEALPSRENSVILEARDLTQNTGMLHILLIFDHVHTNTSRVERLTCL